MLTCQLLRVHVDHLDLTLQAFLLGQRGHHLERVAQDYPVGPLHRVAIEVHAIGERHAVEVRAEHVQLLFAPAGARLAQVLDDRLGADLLLDVDGDRRHDEILAVLLVLALPDELRVQRRVARVAEHLRPGLGLLGERAQLGGGDVHPVISGMLDGLDGGRRGGLANSPGQRLLPPYLSFGGIDDADCDGYGCLGFGPRRIRNFLKPHHVPNGCAELVERLDVLP